MVCAHGSYATTDKYASPFLMDSLSSSLRVSLRLVGSYMSLCPYAYLRVSLSSFLTASDQGSLMTIGELFNISALDPLLPTFLIATLCLCALSVITYYSLALAWEVFWASRRSPSPLDPSAEVVLTEGEELECKYLRPLNEANHFDFSCIHPG